MAEDYTIRLADRLGPLIRAGRVSLLAPRSRVPTAARYERLIGQLPELVADAPRFLLDEVTQHWIDSGDRYTSLKEFPYARPPFATTWFETRRPLVPNAGPLDWSAPLMWGAFVRVVDPVEYAPPGAACSVASFPVFLLRVPNEGEVLIVIGTLWHHLDAEGTILELREGAGWGGVPFIPPQDITGYGPEDEDRTDRWMKYAARFMDPVLLACSLLHCVNVVADEECPPPKLSKAYERRHRQPLTSHRIVRIMPRAARRAVVRTRERKRATPRRHMVRGHFCRRRKDGYGSKQLWWRASYLKGDGTQGAVAHDAYVVEGLHGHS